MKHANERRREQRLCYQWPVWFSEDFGKMLFHGQMFDVSSTGMAFTCNADDNCPYPGQTITTQFSVPRLADKNASDAVSFIRIGRICRVDDTNSFLRRVALQFSETLSFKPGEQKEHQTKAKQKIHTSAT